MRLSTGLLALGLLPAAAHAHSPLDTGALSHLPIWGAQAMLVAAWLLYVAGAVRVRPKPLERAAFHTAMVVAGAAWFGPFDDWAASSTAMHMVQHMLLIVVAAPLWVLARPLPQWRAAIGRAGDWWWFPLLRGARQPMLCAAVHAAAIWAWHVPSPYMAAVQNNWWHTAEHASFALTAWWFWWSVLRARPGSELQAALALLFTLMHTGLLGALLTFAHTPLYYRESRELWDQQLAGLAMWIPGGMAYLVAIAWCGHRWFARLDRREAATGH